jgi:hypothetical protein
LPTTTRRASSSSHRHSMSPTLTSHDPTRRSSRPAWSFASRRERRCAGGLSPNFAQSRLPCHSAVHVVRLSARPWRWKPSRSELRLVGCGALDGSWFGMEGNTMCAPAEGEEPLRGLLNCKASVLVALLAVLSRAFFPRGRGAGEGTSRNAAKLAPSPQPSPTLR